MKHEHLKRSVTEDLNTDLKHKRSQDFWPETEDANSAIQSMPPMRIGGLMTRSLTTGLDDLMNHMFGPEDETDDLKGGLLRRNPGILVDCDTKGMREHLDTKDYDVFDYYYETGVVQAVAKSNLFNNLTLGVISFNAIWIGVDSEHNTKPSGQTDVQFIIAEQFFCIFFTGELLTRFFAFEKKFNCLKDGWFRFDAILVFMMVFETWIMPLMGNDSSDGSGVGDASMLRLLRLLRLSRMIRLMRSVPELVTLLKGMAAAVRSVTSVLILLIIFTYVFAIVFKQQTSGDEELEPYFGSIPEAMWNLLMAGTLLDNTTDVLNLLRERNELMCGVFLMWILLSSFTLLNMLIGVLCEVVSIVSEVEKEKIAVTFAKKQFLDVLTKMDADGSGALSENEFENFAMDPDTKSALDKLEVDRANLKGLCDVIFASTEKEGTLDSTAPRSSTTLKSMSRTFEGKKREIKFADLLEMILDLRATNPAMVKDIVGLRKHLRANHNQTTDFFLEVTDDIEALDQKLVRQDDQMKNISQTLTHQDNKISQLMVGMREIQEKLGCSKLLAVPAPLTVELPPSPVSPMRQNPAEFTSEELSSTLRSPQDALRQVATANLLRPSSSMNGLPNTVPGS